jgi:hypothetical protein
LLINHKSVKSVFVFRQGSVAKPRLTLTFHL